MAGLRLGPLLRYVDEDSATVWVETDAPCEVTVDCDGDGSGADRTWQVGGHHYALVPVTGLRPGEEAPYRVLLDGRQVWPLPDSTYPPSVIRTLPADGRGPLSVAFGSCRWAAPPSGGRGHLPGTASAHDPAGPDALDTLAATLSRDPERPRPDVLLLLGDQVYADETSEATAALLARRRDTAEPPWTQVADYAEYTLLYDESWLDPEVRWLLSTVPSCMIFDDHDVIDDWNTSAAWVAKMRATSWWRERVLGGLMSYWVYQHLGNLSPAELAGDELYAQVRAAEDGTAPVRAFAAAADADPTCARWSYRRDFGRTRLVMVDTRATRVLDEDRRAMLDAEEAKWLREEVLTGPGSYDHLLIGSSLPWLLPNLVHDAEVWDAALCRGVRGPGWVRRGEALRQRADLEHWAAFPESFAALAELLSEAATGPAAPATVCVLSGDVHHAYVAEPHWSDGEQPAGRVLQLTCSPVHNSIPAVMRVGFRFGWSRVGRLLGRALARHARVPQPPLAWRRTGGPWFGNQLMTLTLDGRGARLALDQARRAAPRTSGSQVAGREARLERVLDRSLTP